MPIDYEGDQPKSEKEWRAEGDAHTLARAEAIKADKARHDAARAAAASMLDDEKKDVVLLARVAGKRPGVRPSTPVGKAERKTDGSITGAHNVFKRI